MGTLWLGGGRGIGLCDVIIHIPKGLICSFLWPIFSSCFARISPSLPEFHPLFARIWGGQLPPLPPASYTYDGRYHKAKRAGPSWAGCYSPWLACHSQLYDVCLPKLMSNCTEFLPRRLVRHSRWTYIEWCLLRVTTYDRCLGDSTDLVLK